MCPTFADGLHRMVHAMHERGVSASLDARKNLIGIVKDFFDMIVKKFLPGG